MNSWTFESKEIAKNFDNHVREQLPWYDMVTDAVVYISRNYLREEGKILEIGSSTGNMTKKLLPLLHEKNGVGYIALESSSAMCDEFKSRINDKLVILENVNAVSYCDDEFDIGIQVTVVFLTLMFIPVDERKEFIKNLRKNTMEGGCIIIVDKILDYGGYFATVLKRLGMHFKLLQGAKPADVLEKEMSLAGVQIPIDPELLGDAKMFFRMGEFAGWVIEC